MKIKINNEWLEVTDTYEYDSGMVNVDLEDGTDWYICESSERAGELAKESWAEMANDDPVEFRCMVGDDALISWAMGHSWAVGTVAVSSLTEWLDLWLDLPEEHWGSYDGTEVELDENDTDEELQESLGFIPMVAYRHN